MYYDRSLLSTKRKYSARAARRDCHGGNYCSHVEHRCRILIHWITAVLE
jgi:hypothetical protein